VTSAASAAGRHCASAAHARRGGRGARTVAALEVRENLRDDLRIFDAGDNPHCTPAALTALDIDVEHAFEAACPGQGDGLVGLCALIGGAAPAACAPGDLRAPAAVGGEHAMEAGEVDPRPGNEHSGSFIFRRNAL